MKKILFPFIFIMLFLFTNTVSAATPAAILLNVMPNWGMPVLFFLGLLLGIKTHLRSKKT